MSSAELQELAAAAELEQKLREGCEGSWEAETELGHFKVYYPDELVFILRRPFTNFRLPDLLEPLIQMHEMEDEPKGENLKPALPSTPAPSFTKKNSAWFFFWFRAKDDDINEQILTLWVLSAHFSNNEAVLLKNILLKGINDSNQNYRYLRVQKSIWKWSHDRWKHFLIHSWPSCWWYSFIH